MYGVSSGSLYWSSTEYSGNPNDAYHLYYNSGGLSVRNTYKYTGMQVRCVK
jgi:uncharacterized protein (TIGR02145 family)